VGILGSLQLKHQNSFLSFFFLILSHSCCYFSPSDWSEAQLTVEILFIYSCTLYKLSKNSK